MQNRHKLLWLVLLTISFAANAQTTYISPWAKENRLLERMEIKAQRNTDLNLSTVKPRLIKQNVAWADSVYTWLEQNENPWKLTTMDQYNLTRFLSNNRDYSSLNRPQFLSRDNQRKAFYVSPGNMVEAIDDGFSFVANPVVGLHGGIETDNDDALYHIAVGATARGKIGRHFAYDFFGVRVTENGPQQFKRFVETNAAVPGAVKWDSASSGGVSYWDVRGSVNTNVTKYINIQFGHDRQFIGNGYRSLLLSDFSGNNWFLKFNTRIWRLQYTNIFQQLRPSAIESVNDRLKNKYSSMHHLGINITKWLTIGAFEAIIFGRDNGYDISYLQPMIFLRSMEQQNGSPDNANIGFDFKANVGKTAQLYGQLMLDEFLKDEVIGSSRNWWGNKQAIQIGAKYIDAFGIKNLDLQAEMNQVRPFMYQFRDSTGSYTHANQPLAHPLGGNLREFVALFHYQPAKRLYFDGRIMYWKQGLDSAGYNFGSNPNTIYTTVANGGTRLRNDNYPMFAGMPATGLNASFLASYEIKENLFIDAQAIYRNLKETNLDADSRLSFLFGIRWNMYNRNYDY